MKPAAPLALASAAILSVAALSLAACSTIIEGTDQTVTVITEPPGAVCTLTRAGAPAAVVNPTPGSVSLDKSAENVAIVCEKDGYLDAAGVLASTFEGMTVGNVLFGGLIGVGVDAASGAMHEYPGNVALVLAPEAFPSESDRGAFFDHWSSRIERDAETALAEARETCASGGGNQNCERLEKAVRDARDAELRELERQRSLTRIDDGA